MCRDVRRDLWTETSNSLTSGNSFKTDALFLLKTWGLITSLITRWLLFLSLLLIVATPKETIEPKQTNFDWIGAFSLIFFLDSLKNNEVLICFEYYSLFY